MKTFRDWQHEFYTSKKWKKVRADAIKKNKIKYNCTIPVCEKCENKITNKRGNFGKVVGHHKIEINQDNMYDEAITLNVDNVQCLCHMCHNEIHFGEKLDFYLEKRPNVNLF